MGWDEGKNVSPTLNNLTNRSLLERHILARGLLFDMPSKNAMKIFSIPKLGQSSKTTTNNSINEHKFSTNSDQTPYPPAALMYALYVDLLTDPFLLDSVCTRTTGFFSSADGLPETENVF